MMVRLTVAGLLIAVLAGAVGAQAPDLSRMDIVEKAVPDGPVARVRGTSISAEDFLALYLSQRAEIAAHQSAPVSDLERVRLGLYALRLLVEREVLYHEAQKHGLRVSDAEVEEAFTDEMTILREGLARARGSAVSEEDVLAHAGVSREEALTDLRKSLIIEKMRAELIDAAGITATEAEVREVFEEFADRLQHPDLVQINHILLSYNSGQGPVTDEVKARTLEKVREALGRIQAGQSFQGVARAVSQAPRAAETGGQLEQMPLSALPPFYVEPLQTMKPGDISEPIESEYGYHLVQLVEWTPAGKADFDEVRPRIERQILTQKGFEIVEDFCDRIIADSDDVMIFLQLERVLAYHPDFRLDDEEDEPF